MCEIRGIANNHVSNPIHVTGLLGHDKKKENSNSASFFFSEQPSFFSRFHSRMPLFNFRSKIKSSIKDPLALRKSKSTGNIPDSHIDPTAEQQQQQQRLVPTATNSSLPRSSTGKQQQQEEAPPSLKITEQSGTTSDRRSSSTTSSSSSSISTNADNDDVNRGDKEDRLVPPPASQMKSTTTTVHVKKSNSSPCTPRDKETEEDYFSSNDLERLLSMETQARLEAQEERAKRDAAAAAASTTTPRPTRLKFELPVTPPRSRSPARYSAYSSSRQQRWSLPDESTLDTKRTKKQKKRWSRLMCDYSSSDDEEERSLAIGDRVQLVRRPLPTFGYVRYMGSIEGEPGNDWVGVELDSRGLSVCCVVKRKEKLTYPC